MKVNDSNSAAIGGAGKPQDIQMPPAAGRGGKSGSPASDQVQLSSLSSQLSSMQSGSPERTGRVNQLAAAVSSGTYSVDSKTVGAAILRYAGA